MEQAESTIEPARARRGRHRLQWPPARKSVVSPIGLDLGQSFARAAQLRRDGSGGDERWVVVDAAQWEQRQGAAAAAPHDTAGRLERGFRQRVFRGRRVVVGLSPPDVEIHALELPPATDGENRTPLLAAARSEIERLMRCEEGSVEADFWRVPAGRGSRITALGAGAARARVLEVWNLCRDAGVDCRGIDALPCALARLGSLLKIAPPRHIWGALDLGLRAARLIVCADEAPVLARLLDAGGQKWTQRIADGLQLSPESAERHKRDHGLSLTRRGVRRRNPAGSTAARDDAVAQPAPGANDLGGMIAAVLRADLELLASEIERSYAYVMQCFPDRSIGPLMLAGGGALLGNLDRYLAEKLGIDVRSVNACVTAASSPLTWDSAQRLPASQFAAAIGLALHGGPL